MWTVYKQYVKSIWTVNPYEVTVHVQEKKKKQQQQCGTENARITTPQILIIE